MRLSAMHRSRFYLAFFALVPLAVLPTIPAGKASAQAPMVVQSQPVQSGVFCPKCGRVHASASPTPRPVQTVSATAEASQPRVLAGGLAQNVLGMLNGQRSRQGLRSLRYDAALQSVAERRASLMASTGTKSHPPGSFAPGRYEGVGWSSSYSPSGVSACYTSDPNMTAAGAAMVTGRDGVYFAVVYR